MLFPNTGQCDEPGLVETFTKNHQIGMRLGGWANLGGLPPDTIFNPINNSILKTKLGDGNFYLEGFFGYRINEQLMLELSLGISNRGSVTLSQNNSTNVGNVIIYPVLVQMKVYLLSMTDIRLQPYMFAGGGLYYGRRSTQVSSSGIVYTDDQESEADFHYSFGGGMDFPLGHDVAADLNIKYMPIMFSKTFVAINDYKGIGITLGIKYLYSFKKSKGSRKERI
jgi:opacity protein-like surface antigen